LIDADAKAHPASFLYVSIALRHGPLDCHCTLGGVHDAAKHGQDTITGGVNDATAVLLDHGEQDRLVLLESANRVGFIRAMRALYPAMSAARIAANLREILVFSGPSVIYPYLAECVEQY